MCVECVRAKNNNTALQLGSCCSVGGTTLQTGDGVVESCVARFAHAVRHRWMLYINWASRARFQYSQRSARHTPNETCTQTHLQNALGATDNDDTKIYFFFNHKTKRGASANNSTVAESGMDKLRERENNRRTHVIVQNVSTKADRHKARSRTYASHFHAHATRAQHLNIC